MGPPKGPICSRGEPIRALVPVAPGCIVRQSQECVEFLATLYIDKSLRRPPVSGRSIPRTSSSAEPVGACWKSSAPDGALAAGVEWLQDLAALGRSEGTIGWYQQKMRQYVAKGGPVSLAELTAYEFKRFLAELQAAAASAVAAVQRDSSGQRR